MTTREIVVIEQCWGCNTLRVPKPWAGWLDVLRAEGRLRYREYLCDRPECSAERIAAGR